MNKLIIKTKTLRIFIPIVLSCLFPVLFFYSFNISILNPKFLQTMLTYSLLGGIITYLVVFILIRNQAKASIISTLLILIFFSYGHISQSLNNYIFIKLPNNSIIGPDKILLPIFFCITVLVIFKIVKTKKNQSQLVNAISIFLLLLTINQVYTVINYEYIKGKFENTIVKNEYGQHTNTITPDIYHIILDGYARNDVLEEYYNYDNSAFTDSLRGMGFYVVEKARANYIHTYLSLTSTFNMTYLDILQEKYGENPANGSAAIELMVNNLVTQKLRNYGYTIINFSSEWEGTNENYKADLKFKSDQYSKILGLNLVTSETNMIFLQTTILSPLIKNVWGDALRARILTVFEKLPDIPYIEQKKFTLAHILAPHPPYVFNADGSAPENFETQNADEQIAKRPDYRNQLIFVSKQTIPVLQKIISNSKNPPIIILQSDHGPASTLGIREEWCVNYGYEGLNERSGILLAIYFPDQDFKDLYHTMTPVNIYPIIFNKYFEENIKLFSDKTYYSDYSAIYKMKDIGKEID